MARAFERPATIALPGSVGEGLALEGLYVPVAAAAAAGGAVIAAPHPLMGGSMDSPVVTEIAWACQRAGRASLRFNWRGVGASGGETSGDIGDADVDYASATAFLTETVPGPIMACGYSFGAIAALRATTRDPVPQRLLLVAPPTGMLDASLLASFSGEILLVAGHEDQWVDTTVLSSLAAEGARVRTEVIPGCDHFFVTGLGKLGRALADWLESID
jgi:hypothetical protein